MRLRLTLITSITQELKLSSTLSSNKTYNTSFIDYRIKSFAAFIYTHSIKTGCEANDETHWVAAKWRQRSFAVMECANETVRWRQMKGKKITLTSHNTSKIKCLFLRRKYIQAANCLRLPLYAIHIFFLSFAYKTTVLQFLVFVPYAKNEFRHTSSKNVKIAPCSNVLCIIFTTKICYFQWVSRSFLLSNGYLIF